MKDRIKQLALQAGYIDKGNNQTAYAKFNHEEFAELIVRECSVALHLQLRDMISRGQAYDLIKEHFGVK